MTWSASAKAARSFRLKKGPSSAGPCPRRPAERDSAPSPRESNSSPGAAKRSPSFAGPRTRAPRHPGQRAQTPPTPTDPLHRDTRAGGHYILGEKLRGESKEARAALARQGRYHVVAGNLRVKEVVVDDGTMRDRFLVCHKPGQAVRDKAVREQILAQLEGAIAGSDALTRARRADLACALEAKPGYRRFLRFLRRTPSGLLRSDRAAVAAEERLDGKFLLRTSDPTLSAEDIALGYKQLLEVERAWRDLKTTLDLRPIYHRKEERIRAHVLLCWLTLLLIRIVEHATGNTWRNLRNELERMHLGTFAGPAGLSRQRTELTPGQKTILRALELPEPPRFLHLEPAAPAQPARARGGDANQP